MGSSPTGGTAVYLAWPADAGVLVHPRAAARARAREEPVLPPSQRREHRALPAPDTAQRSGGEGARGGDLVPARQGRAWHRDEITTTNRRARTRTPSGRQPMGSRRTRNESSPMTTMLPSWRSSSTCGRLATSRPASCSTRRPQPQRSDVQDVPALFRQDVDEPRGQVVVRQQPHADGRSGSRRSRTVGAPPIRSGSTVIRSNVMPRWYDRRGRHPSTRRVPSTCRCSGRSRPGGAGTCRSKAG